MPNRIIGKETFSTFPLRMRAAQEYGVVTAEEAEQWILALEEAMRTGRFFHAMMWFISIGRKPG